MSGIAGIFSPNKLKKSSEEHLVKMLGKLKHRGPDGLFKHIDLEQGLVIGQTYLQVSKDPSNTSPVFIGTSREGAQNEDFVASADGRFYEFQKIRNQLQLEGYRFKSKNDHEILLPLYQQYGLDFVDHLRGEFAISLFDPKKKRLILARDRFGVRPLFYHVNGDSVYWSSEVKGLLAHPEITPAFSKEGLLHQLIHTMVPGTSAFEGINAVRPGHMLILDYSSGSLKVEEKEYWDMKFPTEAERAQDVPAETYIEEIREKLSEAVQVRLVAEDPVGSYLSGGIDSCSILGLASNMSQEPLKTYTISFDDDAYDESHIAREMAKRVDADQEQIRLTADDLYGENYVNTLYHAERTFYNTLGVAKFLMSKKVRETGYKVALTGEGSDELFGGYPSFKRDMLRFSVEGEGDQAQRDALKEKMDQSNKLFTGAILSEVMVKHPLMEERWGFTPSWIQPWMLVLELAKPLLHDDLQEELKDYDPIAEITKSINKERLDGRHVLDKAQYTWSKTMVECQILNWGGDRVDMAHSMESRPPFLDHHVVEAAAQIPPHFRINGSTEKWIFRESVKHIIPETLYKREKFAFMAPPSHTDERKRNGLKKLIAQYMDGESIQRAGIFDPQRLQTFMEEYWVDKDPVSLTRKDTLINHILSLHILWHLYIKDAA